MTRRLYHDDVMLRRFDASVVAHATYKDKPAIVLDATAFYPEAGGQLGDRGTLGGATVLDTQELDDGTIIHLVDGTLPAIGTNVTGELDWARRRQHMAQHTAQHLLSGALLDRAQAPTASARLGESALTIDVTRDRIPDAEIAAAEDLANDLIDDDLAIRAWFPTADELAQLQLRRDPKVAADIRVVAIGDFDFSPCGGTHATRTSQLGSLRVTNAERYKGMTRVTFTAGRRARAELFTRDQVLRQLATRFSCAPADVPAAIDKASRDAEAATAEVTQLRSRLASMIADSFHGTGAVIAAMPGDADLLRSVAAKLTAAGRDALLAAPDDTGTTVVLFRAAGSSVDCGALFKKLAATAGGRGGGRPDRAEGRLATRIENWGESVRTHLNV
ncbi:MAG: alanyl-tRNA editing protein [Deltaproteobacteria bacterium]|nr:alanyl-tRNA editing protein [Deltaproteobacteria bacterium]